MNTTEHKNTVQEVPLGDDAIKCLKVLRQTGITTVAAIMLYMGKTCGLRDMLAGLKELGIVGIGEGKECPASKERWFLTTEGIAELDKSVGTEKTDDLQDKTEDEQRVDRIRELLAECDFAVGDLQRPVDAGHIGGEQFYKEAMTRRYTTLQEIEAVVGITGNEASSA